MPYIYDTFAVLEYLNRNKRYKRYFEEDSGLLTTLNLMEIYYALLREHDENAAEETYSASSKFIYEFDDLDVKGAMKLRLNFKRQKRNLSYADALGYYLSLKLKVKFLTGDSAFKELVNVEYVR